VTALTILIATLALLVLYAGWRTVRMFATGDLDGAPEKPERAQRSQGEAFSLTYDPKETTAPDSFYGRVMLTRPDDDGLVGVWTWNPPQSSGEPYPPGEAFTFTHDPEAPDDPTAGIIRLGAVPYEPPPKRIVRRTPPCLRRRLRR